MTVGIHMAGAALAASQIDLGDEPRCIEYLITTCQMASRDVYNHLDAILENARQVRAYYYEGGTDAFTFHRARPEPGD